MLIIPAIDLQAKAVVRLVKGKGSKKVYSYDPVEIASGWQAQGAKLIHVVDLDGAFSGSPKNLSLLKNILKNIPVPIEFGGGIRTFAQIKNLLKLGVYRVVLGTRAIEDKRFLRGAFKKFKNKIIVSIDARRYSLLTKGWKSSSKKTDLLSFIIFLKETGFKQFIYTDTSRDGTLKGPNIEGIKKLLKYSGMQIIASGGVGKLEDIHRLKKLKKNGLTGVIVGKALYEKKFTLTQAKRIA